MAVKYNHNHCCILAHCHSKTLQEKLHERSEESHARFAWTSVTTDPCIPVSVTYRDTSATAIFDPHTHQYSAACTDTLRTIPSTEGKKTSEVHYSEDYKPENKTQEIRILNSRSLIRSQIDWLTLISTGHYYLLKVILNLHINKTVRNRVIMNDA